VPVKLKEDIHQLVQGKKPKDQLLLKYLGQVNLKKQWRKLILLEF